MFESFNDFLNNEARDFNDPLLIKMRAAQMKAQKKKGASNSAKKELSPAKAKKLAKLEDERAQIMRDMEQEAEMEGGETADRYGDMLNKIDKQIAKLTESEVTEGTLDQGEIAIYIGKEGTTHIFKRGKGYYGFNDEFDFEAKDKKELEKMLKKWRYELLAGDIDEAFDGNMKDFKYEFPIRFEDVTGNPVKAIKKISKKGKGFEVRTSTYMSEPEMQEVADEMGLELVSYKKDSNIAIAVYESIDEAKRSTVHKAAKKGSYPAIIVVVQDGKVIHQEEVSTPDAAPAAFNVIQEKYPKALLHLEDKTGKRLFSESVVTEGYGEFIKAKNLTDIIKLSKEKKNATFYVTDDNNSRIGTFYLKNGKFAKATTANPSYDLQNSKTKLKDRSDVIYKYKVDESVVTEGKVQLKRKYTENYPAITAGKSARIRNKIIEAIGDGKITQEEFDSILKELSSNSARWSKMNTKYFNVSEDGISLSKFGRRTLKQITINENMDKFIFESFKEFTNSNKNTSINEGTRGQFGIIDKKGAIKSVYMHYDSYPEHVLNVINKNYKVPAKINQVIDKGDNSGLDAINKMSFYDDGNAPLTGKKSKINNYISDADSEGAEYVYLYDESDKTWYMVDVYGDRELVAAFESVVNEDFKDVSDKFKAALDNLPDSKFNTKDIEALIKKHKENRPDAAMAYTKKAFGWLFKESVEVNEDMICEATVEMDAMDPDNKDFLKFLKKNKVKITSKEMSGPGAGTPVITMQGKRKDLENVLADGEFGWDDADLAEYIEESVVNEAFKSSKLRTLLSLNNSIGYGSRNKKALPNAFYELSKIKIDQIEDADLSDHDPISAYKEFKKSANHVIFFVVDNEKINPYSDSRAMDDAVKPGIIGIARANSFMSPQIGGNKEYKGYGASGIYNVKRAADLADRAIVINIEAVKDLRGNASVDKNNRANARSGAIAFQSDRDFKKANMLRYKDILATKASKLPLDKMVEASIDELTNQIKDGLAKGEQTRYGDILIGKNKKGNDVKMRDASNHMSSILDSYSRYVSYMEEERKAKDDGYSSNFYAKEAKSYAKRLTDDIKKIKSFDYAW